LHLLRRLTWQPTTFPHRGWRVAIARTIATPHPLN